MNLEFHPVANIFPLLQGLEFEALKADIEANGLIEPIWLHPDGRIIDGRNRYRACNETGAEPKFEVYQGGLSTFELLAFVMSLNFHRRHLSSSQLAAIAAEILPDLEKEARERQGERRDLTSVKDFTEVKMDMGDLWQADQERKVQRATEQAAQLFNTNHKYVSDAKKLKEQAPTLFEQVKSGEMSIPQAKQELARQRTPESAITPELPQGKYRCLVIDPPWPVKKIEREERPNQGIELDYPTMSLEEIEALPIPDLAEESGCHLYLWVTQKFLPAGLQMVESWGFNYQCLMTWRKNVGFTPYSWMYDTEHVIFARRGNLPLQQLGLRLSFDAPVNGHSVKPDVFFDERVVLASPEPRLEMFARRSREGFTVYGNEV